MRESSPAEFGGRQYAPAHALRAYVRHFNYLELDCLAAPVPVMPSTTPILNFYLGTAFDAYEYSVKASRRLPGVVAVGPLTHRVADVTARAPLSILSVRFHPTGFARLFRIGPRAILDRAYDAVDVLGSPVVALRELLMETRGIEARIALVERYLLACLNRESRPAPWVQHAADLLERSRGVGDVASLLQPLPLSERQLRRQFVEQIGVAPKTFQQIIRFNRVYQLMRRHPQRTLGSIGAAAGFYDGSHLYSEFVQVIHQSPSDFSRSLNSASIV